ncbi:MAG: hypothetical protein AAFY28_22695, partial [Actinomycetota bacterium]
MTDSTQVRVSTGSGRIEVVAEPGRHGVWSSTGEIDDVDGQLTIDAGSGRVRVLVPEGTDLVVGTTSGRVAVRGRAGDVSVLATSGAITIDDAASVDARTRGGKIIVGRATGVCRANTGSGKVQIDACRGAQVTVTS